MTVQDTAPSVTFVGTGAQLSFPFTFRADDPTWLTLDYLVNFDQFVLNADQDASPGGSVDYTVAPPFGQELTVTRDTPNTQELDYTRYDPFDSEATEDSIDKLTMQIQDLDYYIQNILTQDFDLLGNVDFSSKVDGSMVYWDAGTMLWMDTAANLTFTGGNLFTFNQSALFNFQVNINNRLQIQAGNDIEFRSGSGANWIQMSTSGANGEILSDGTVANFVFSNFSGRIMQGGQTLAYVSELPVVVSDHTLLTNIGVNTHAQIDTHIADATIHFTEASIDHANLIGTAGTFSHGIIDSHINNATIHFQQSAIDHVNIMSIGVNTHAQIDSHVADSTIHFLEASIDHTAISNIGVNSHAAIDTHIATANIHYVDAPSDGTPYARQDAGWVAASSGGGLNGFGIWRYRTATDAFPTAGRMQFDNVTIDSATNMYINEVNDGGTDVTNFLALLVAGDLVYVQVQDTASQFVIIEIGTPVLNADVWTFPVTQIEAQGTAPSNNTQVAIVASLGAGGGVTDHGALTGLVPDDDHTQYVLDGVGRATPQSVIGGLAAGNELVLQGSSAANRGRVVAAGGLNVDWDFTSDAITSGGILFQNTIPASGGLISSNITIANNITVNNALFIMSALDDNSTLTWTVSPGFAVTTLFFARQNYRSSTNGVAPAQALIYAAQSQYWITGAGDVTTSNYVAVSFVPIIRTDNNGDRMRITATTGLRVNPAYNTRNANSTADYGTIRGVHMQNATQVLFGQSLGAEIATAWIGLDVEALTGLTVSGRKAAVRSNIATGANNRFLENLGGANSDHGNGHMYFWDNRGIAYGGVGINYDVWTRWNGSEYATNFFSTGDDLLISSPSADRFLFEGNAGNTAVEFNFNVAKFSMGAQAGTNGNQVGNFVAGTRSTAIGGEWSDFLLTQAANITVDHAMGGVFGWTINAPSITLGTGTVTTAGALNIGGNVNQGSVNRFGVRILSNPSGGSGINAALWVTAGLTQLDGPLETTGNLGFYGTAAIAQPATPVTLADVITSLQNLGLVA